MRNRDRFNEAFGHVEHEVMGRRLGKLTLKHRFWLEALECPLVKGGEARLMDLEMASRVCSIPFADLDRLLPKVIGRGPGFFDKIGYLWKVWRRSAEMEYRKFQAYLLDHGCPPATWDSEAMTVVHEGAAEGEEPEEEGALPGVFGLVSGLIRCAHWNPDVVWGLSPGEAEWYLAGVFMHRGVDVGLKTGADEDMEEFLRAREAAKAANLKPETLNSKEEKEGRKSDSGDNSPALT
jgi:hypothetical protein